MKNLNQMELDLSTSSQEAILANLSPSQVEKKVSKIRDTSGQTILGLSKSSGPLGSLEKMLVGTLNKVSTPYYRTWRVKVTPQGRLVFQLQASARTTKGRESSLWRTPDNLAGGSNLPGIQKALDEGHLKRPSGQPIQIRLHDQVKEPRLWPTPSAGMWKQDVNDNGRYAKDIKKKGYQIMLPVEVKLRNQKMWPTPKATDYFPGVGKYVEENQSGYTITRKKTGTKFGAKLADAVDFKETWATPTVQDAKNNAGPSQMKRKTKPLNVEVTLWPTPAATEGKQGYQKRPPGMKGNQVSLTTKVVDSKGGREKVTGQLNPTWVEWVMGYQIGWTDLKD